MQILATATIKSSPLSAGIETDLLPGGALGFAPQESGGPACDSIVIALTETAAVAVQTLRLYVSSGVTGNAGTSSGVLVPLSATTSLGASGSRVITLRGFSGGNIRLTATSSAGASVVVGDIACSASFGSALPSTQIAFDGVVQGASFGGTISGNLSQSAGTVSINANGASSIATTSGALTIDPTGALNLGPTNATSVVVGASSVAPSFPGGATVGAAKAITGAGALAVEAASASTLTLGGASNAVTLGQASKVTTIAGGLTLSQGLALHAVRPSSGAFPYSALATDLYIGVTSTASARVVTLLNAATLPANTVIVVKDESGGAGTNSITVKATTSTLDGTLGATGLVISSNYGVLRLISDGTNYFTF